MSMCLKCLVFAGARVAHCMFLHQVAVQIIRVGCKMLHIFSWDVRMRGIMASVVCS